MPNTPHYSHSSAYLHYLLTTAAYCERFLANFTCTPCRLSNTTASDVRVFDNHSTDARAFSAVIADLRDEMGVSDNVDGGSVILEQSPEPGTVVTQGMHEILFTARDEAGNSSIAQTFLTVAPVVAITSFPNYLR